MNTNWNERERQSIEQSVNGLSAEQSIKNRLKMLLRDIINAGSPEYGDKTHTSAHFGNAKNLITLFQSGKATLDWIEEIATTARKKIAGL